MRPLVSPQEMAAADRAAIESGTPTEQLMERAGRAVARAAIRLAGGRYGKRATIVAGPGNNGGDGFVAARILAREGVGVRCLLVGDRVRMKGAALQHLLRMVACGIEADPFDPVDVAGDVIVDAIFGTGFRGRAEGDAAAAIEAINRASAPVVAVDIPSGVDGSTGSLSGPGVEAEVTVAMGAEKYGTATGRGAALAGRIEVADIGIPLVGEAAAVVIERDDVRLPPRPPDAHKRTSGSVAILAGSDETRGAPLLTSLGAVRAGAGYATLGSTAAVKQAAPAVLPELLCVAVSDADVLGPGSLEAFGEVLERADALAIGPGIGTGPDQQKLVASVLTDVDLPVVADADALNVLAGHPGPLRARAGRTTVLTPHPAELARLLGTSTAEVQADRLGSARRAASDFGCVVLLKGYRPIVAAPDEPAAIIPIGGPELATAGTGDVLTGIVAAFLARGLDGWRAAWTALFVGNVAASAAALRGGEGLLASDIPEALPAALAALGSGR